MNTTRINQYKRRKDDGVCVSLSSKMLALVTAVTFAIIFPTGISFPLHHSSLISSSGGSGIVIPSTQQHRVPLKKDLLGFTTRTKRREVKNKSLIIQLYGKSKSIIEEGRISSNESSKTKYSKNEQLLLQELNQLRNQIIQSSKQRKENSFSNESIDDDDGNNDDAYYSNQKKKLIQMMNILQAFQSDTLSKQKQNKSIYIDASRIIDNTLRHCTNEALQLYSNKRNNNRETDNDTIHLRQHSTMLWKQVQFGLEVMDLQFSSSSSTTMATKASKIDSKTNHTSRKNVKILSSPYDAIPQSVCLQALKALNVLLQKKSNNKNSRNNNEYPIVFNSDNPQIQQSNAAFRILQRLCTGNGVRTNSSSLINDNNGDKSNNKSSKQSQPRSKSSVKVQINLDERDFNMVLNGFVNTNQMIQAHRVIALQVRTKHAPPLSPITYSILIKGYGNLNDVNSVDLCMRQCSDHGIKPDIIMYNSLIDAYINCDEIELAHDVFKFLTKNGLTRFNFGSEKKPYLLYGQDASNMSINADEEEEVVIPTPNVRTYNTMLKGFVKHGDIKQAMKLSDEMKQAKLWDDITTNTLVSAAIAVSDFELAESILNSHTNYSGKNKGLWRGKIQQHPNVEAYTELLDGYAKANSLNKALSVLKLMRERGVNPNEYSYTCMIGALAKAQKIDQAKKLLEFMEISDGIPPSIITYNAFLTGMLEKYILDDRRSSHSSLTASTEDIKFNMRVDEAIQIFEIVMQKPNLYPNDITAATMVDALSRCKPPRLDEAKELIVELGNKGLVLSSNQRVCTALIRACTNSLDLDGIENAYSNLQNPDTISFNSLIDGYCRCGKVKKGLEAMADNNDLYRDGGKYITPDVVTYTILISAVLRIGTSAASSRALLLYNEMKSIWEIIPDQALVDM